MDRAWWRVYRQEAERHFTGERYTCASGVHGVKRISRDALANAENSGACAMMLAAHFGAARIILLGYDCHKRGGAHHHGNHPKGMGNAGSLPKWPKQFADVAKRLTAEIVNCSPGTALDCWPKRDLNEVL